MSIKAGDLVMLVKTENQAAAHFIGGIRTVGMPSEVFKKHWHLVPPTHVPPYEKFSWAEWHLKKIDPPSSGELKGVPLRLKEPA